MLCAALPWVTVMPLTLQIDIGDDQTIEVDVHGPGCWEATDPVIWRLLQMSKQLDAQIEALVIEAADKHYAEEAAADAAEARKDFHSFMERAHGF